MKRKYVPDLTRQTAQCEANYARMLKLLPDIDDCGERDFHVRWQQHQTVVRLSVEERFKYTTTVRLSYQHDGQSPWLEAPALLIRLYHDARVAEVVCLQRSQLSGVYPYPNREMHQPDEKLQLNEYLGEWLGHCLDRGHHPDPVYVS
ncbi:DUF1249 domain-containing protein [Marinobacterium jannaschii]|uniref:DUF1249 domain-containing protein n=1 Tax=Marinobacterium jannaschii TaxID=64970 RepID=UPI0004849002|nr:DUF1249 domain-containing protein [Marinobacterium jannaschii]